MRRSVPCSIPLARLTIAAPRRDVRPRLGQHRAQAVRRHREHDDVGVGARRARGRRSRAARPGARCPAGSRGSRDRRRCSPRALRGAPTTTVGALPAHDRGDRRAPRAGADHGDSRHARSPVRARGVGIAPPPRSSPRRRARVDLAGAGDALDDRRHHPIGRLLHVLVGPGHDRLADHRGLRDTPLPVRLAALREDPVRAPQPDRRDRDAGAPREPRGARLRDHRLEILGDRSLGEHADALAAPQRVDRRRRARRPRRRGPGAPGSGARRAAAGRAPACRTARPWRGSARGARAGRRPTRASAGRGTTRDCSRARPGPTSGMLCAPSIVQCRPHRSQGENTPFATEYTGSTLGSIRRPCRPGAFPTPQASSSRCGRLRSGKARLADALDDDARRAFTRTMAERVVAAAGDSTRRDRVERARGHRVGARRSALAHIADPGTLDARRRRRARVGSRPRPRPGRRDARRPPARDRRSTASPTTPTRRSR